MTPTIHIKLMYREEGIGDKRIWRVVETHNARVPQIGVLLNANDVRTLRKNGYTVVEESKGGK